MIQRGHGARFAVEPFGELGRRTLDRDVTVQPGVAGFVDLADQREDFYGPS